MKLQDKVFIVIISVNLLSLLFIVPFIAQEIISEKNEKIRIDIQNITETFAENETIIENLEIGDTNGKIQNYIKKILPHLKQIEFIVIADMNGTRFSHPDESMIGKKFKGGDEERVLKAGERYISEAEGTLGVSTRAFSPIFNSHQKQIGFVSVGILKTDIKKSLRRNFLKLFLYLLFEIIIATITAYQFTKYIKNKLLGYEPEELGKLYNEKTDILDAINEGIIAIDLNSKITLVNRSTMKILQLKTQEDAYKMLGKDINTVFDNSKLQNIIKTGEPEYDKEMILKDTIVVVNRVPIRKNGKITGALATFRDKTEITKLAEEVTGVKQLLAALRANTHEFKNKLHVILGLLHMGDIEEAKSYIKTVSQDNDEQLTIVTSKIKDSVIAGLILGKMNRAKELQIKFSLDNNSYFNGDYSEIVTKHMIITIIGNLLENSFEALEEKYSKTDFDKETILYIKENNNNITIRVKDNGKGINNQNKKKIFQKWISTKGEGRGIGLSLINNIIENCNGTVTIESFPNKGTEIELNLPKIINRVEKK